ncbi:MAG: hypothetical protein M1823_008842, partial [Watsoniomyces obsoletus]
DVYDLTNFQEEHPGGKKILQRVAGKDASKQFWKYQNESILKKYKGELQVGSLDTKKKSEPAPAPAKEKVVPSAESGTVAPSPGPAAHEDFEAMDTFGS